MRKSVLCMLFLCLVSLYAVTAISAQTWQDIMQEAQDLFRQGSQEQAQKLLYLARDIAWQEGSWEGSLQAGLGFVALGRDDKEARLSYVVTRDLAAKQERWEGVLGAGQGFASLGEEEEAHRAYYIARDLARGRGRWEGVLETGRAFEGLRDFKEAEVSYGIAKRLSFERGVPHQFGRNIRFSTSTLIKQRDLLIFEPGVASSWSVSADEKTITLQLRQGIRCFNNSSVNARAVVTTFEENPRTWKERLRIASVEEVDANQVRIKILVSLPEALKNLARPEASIQCLP